MTPSYGLTLALGDGVKGSYYSVTFRNHSEKPIQIDCSANNLSFSAVTTAGTRKLVAAGGFKSPREGSKITVPPMGTVTVSWPLDGAAGHIPPLLGQRIGMIKVLYSAPNSPWAEVSLQSNTLQRFR